MFNNKKIKELEEILNDLILDLTEHFLLQIDKVKQNDEDKEEFKEDISELKRLRDDDLELIASLSLQNSQLKKAIHNQRESIMLLMEHFKLYFDIEDNKKVVKKDKKK